MLRVTIPNTRLQTSRLGFGTSTLHHLGSLRSRQNLLSAAAANGITHFDTARMYGDGIGERSLGSWLKTRSRQNFTIATKFGILPDSLSDVFPPWAYASRAIRYISKTKKPHDVRSYSPPAARASVERSLQLLQTDYVDILFIHEPRREDLLGLPQLADLLRLLKQEGKIRYAGVAGAADVCVAASMAMPGCFDVLQVQDSLSCHQADSLRAANLPLQITYGYLRNSHLAAGSPDLTADQILIKALRRNTQGVVLVSTRKVERIPALARAASAI